MAKRHSERVRGVGWLWCLGHSEERSHHRLDLLFGSVSIACHGSFYLARRVARYRNSLLRRGQQYNAANLSESKRCFHIERSEDRFDRDTMRLEFFDQRGDEGMDFAKRLGKMFGAVTPRAQGAKTQRAAAASVALDHAIPGSAGRGRIDA